MVIHEKLTGDPGFLVRDYDDDYRGVNGVNYVCVY